jgi:hypothetical protein
MTVPSRGSIVNGPAIETNPVVVSVLLVWILLAIGVGLSGRFLYASPQVVAATVWGLVILTIILFWNVGPLRAFAMSLQPKHLLSFNLLRFVGLAFVYLYSVGRFPLSFGLLGGIGDCLVAASAAVLLCLPRWQHRKPFLAWNVFGLVDIVGVVFSALRDGLHYFHFLEPLR